MSKLSGEVLTSDDIDGLLRVFFRDKGLSWDNTSDHIKRQIAIGYKIELEHVETINRLFAEGARDDAVVEVVISIVFDHLIEVVDYYDRLPKLEADSKAYYDSDPELSKTRDKLHRNIQYLGLAIRGMSV